MKNEIKIVIADDHPIFRKGLKEIIAAKENYIVEGEAGDGDEIISIILKLNPQIAVIDIDMPCRNGFDVAQEINNSGIDTKIIFLTMHNAKDLLDEAMNLNVKGFVLKENAVTEILEAIEQVDKGMHYISPQVSSHIFSENKFADNYTEQKLLLNKLTQTEKRILKLISLQKSTKEIADEMFISPKTIETHRSHITSKLNLHGQNSLLKFAIDNKNII